MRVMRLILVLYKKEPEGGVLGGFAWGSFCMIP